MSALNAEGMTWAEWINAATFKCNSPPTKSMRRKLRKEWKVGVDPTEWAAHFERERR